MSIRVELRDGLPSHGPPATSFPADWGRLGREGVVAEIRTEASAWTANVQRGLSGIDHAALHPNRNDVVVFARGDLWVIDPVRRMATCLLPCVESLLEVEEPRGWIMSRQGIALARLGPEGLMWHTRRLSWDGLELLALERGTVTGRARGLDDAWHPFQVDAVSGRSRGGSYLLGDREGWEQLAGTPRPSR